MNPTSDRNTLDLFKCHPSLLDGDKIKEIQFSRPYKLTFVFAQPRSGSTLLMRLMNMACLSPMIGDRPITFYSGLLDVYKGMMQGQVGHLFLAEERGEFWDCYQADNIQRRNYLLRTMASTAFGCANYMSSSSKSTMIGFGNNLVAPMVDMLRECFADRETEYELKIVYLTRDHEQILKSLQTREGSEKPATLFPEKTLELLENQKKQFQDAWKFEDSFITYDQLLENTEKTLMKLNPLYPPNKKAMQSILNKKIR